MSDEHGYCKHGIYVGGCGIDWMCGRCETPTCEVCGTTKDIRDDVHGERCPEHMDWRTPPAHQIERITGTHNNVVIVCECEWIHYERKGDDAAAARRRCVDAHRLHKGGE